ncbi:hypothetical protein BDP81DRAFT_178397 [Colletotrichum phormii]|uniref:Uncharacterized protein n=1 Tax=Colletotrichum phormii TaxID=359342 RepID=A0AAJ0EHQ6_9PEZI|nr:uncharacterized protein BDP81DRAFT_178397 [Colletotrichum phormii]KAK1639503.1 hypothetical protein BDP81DRAFT_178397 [Colletotrichum phormii]
MLCHCYQPKVPLLLVSSWFGSILNPLVSARRQTLSRVPPPSSTSQVGRIPISIAIAPSSALHHMRRVNCPPS